MKIITCGPIVTYVICGSHVATIVYAFNNGAPSATIYYDGQLGEIVEAENGQTMRFAMRLAIWSVKRSEYCDRPDDWSVSAEDLTEWQAASCGCDYYVYKNNQW